MTIRTLIVTCVMAIGVVPPQLPAPREVRIGVDGASLYGRDVGRGEPLVILHGGPDFDISYLLPDLDRLASSYRLIYYDQRGRGQSAQGVKPEDVTLASEIADLDKVREHFQLETMTLVGHSWGAVLALEYALRHPARLARLILMNPAPASAADLAFFRSAYVKQLGSEMEQQRTIANGPSYQAADPDAVTARYRIHFKHALARAADYEKLMTIMHAGFVKQGSDGILKARAVEDRLMADTWAIAGYDLLPKIRTIAVPTLVLTADHDFIPVEIAAHIAQAMPKAQLVTLKNCGHFAFMECPADVRAAVDTFLR